MIDGVLETTYEMPGITNVFTTTGRSKSDSDLSDTSSIVQSTHSKEESNELDIN